MIRYQIAVNLELTNTCNASCSMCPRSQIKPAPSMTTDCFRTVLQRLDPDEVFRVILAGFGEPTIHPRHGEFMDMLRDHPVRFDMVSNGHAMDSNKLQELDGAIDLLIVSFSSIVKEVYDRVHVRLDQKRVMANIMTAHQTLQNTQLAISLTPTTECLETLPETIEWFRGQGIHLLTMSPTLYNRAGSMEQERDANTFLRSIIKKYDLRSQEMEFVPSLWNNLKQQYHNRFNCIPRNTVMPISANGDYQYCFNDIGRRHQLGNVANMTLSEALRLREKTSSDSELCANCNIKHRYGIGELLRFVGHYLHQNLKQGRRGA